MPTVTSEKPQQISYQSIYAKQAKVKRYENPPPLHSLFKEPKLTTK
jgi:hypothetical protein